MYLYYILLVPHTYASYIKALMYILWLWNTIQSSSISNMVSEPLLWPFLSNLVFISVTPFSTSLSSSQQPPQPFAVEPPTSSSCWPWVPDLQPPSLRNFTLHRPLPFASLLQILLRIQLWRYHRDRLALIYTLVKASTPSETTRAPTHCSKALFRWSCTRRAFHAPLHIWVLSHAPPRAVTSGHASSRALTRLNLLVDVIHISPRLHYCWRHLLASAADIIFWLWGLTVDFDWDVDFDRSLFSKVDFFSLGSPYLVFRVDFIFVVCFCILCF